MTTHLPNPRAAALAALALCCLASAGTAQTVLLDQGTFRLSLAGRDVGRDSFDIRRSGSGDDARVQAQGWTDYQGLRTTSVVETTAGFELTRYRATVTGAESSEVRARALPGRRMEVTLLSPAGERTREMRAPEGAVLLEEGAAHAYYFVGALGRPGAALPLLAPRLNEQPRIEVQSVTQETVSVGGVALEARRMVLSVGGSARWLWVDAQGRVLRVEVPSTGFVAERLRPPA